jgi:class 3 adenylate cyclase/tetratricopeptide (TPR) repeat protein
MKCPKCQHENPIGAKFCNECATKLELICPECGKANPSGSKFCNECAHNLTITASEPASKDLSFDEKLNKIQRYLPKGLTEKILSQRDRIEGERKHVTVMFCDMEGFTHLSEKLGPEEAYAVMDQVYEILIHKVHDYEGTVNEMTGDGIMALFGAPIALEDAPQRAIRSSLSIHREMAKFTDRMKREKENILAPRMRIGIHSGLVVVGTLGNNLRVEFKAVGDTVNLASRTEGLAEPGTTYITEDTFKLSEGFFRFEALGKRKIKGKEEPVQIYRAIAPSTRRTRFDVSAERGLTPFVGRERERELLLDGFERAKEGQGQAFSIVSEAGVGKSRLLYEFRKAVANEDVTFMEGKCLSYSRGVAYHPVIDIVKSNFDIVEGDRDFEITEKLKRGLKVLDTEESSTLPYLLELLSVKDSGIGKILMSPEAKKDRIMEAIKRNTLKGSEIRPLVMAIEDLHWIDSSSEEYLKNLLGSISSARVFLIFTYRPEFVHTWGRKSYHSQVNLNRLSNREILVMLSYLLDTEDIDKDLETLILQKTEGVPFFIEEIVNSLKELKIIERKDNKYHLAKDIQEMAIPSTIQDVIMARVDSLPEGAKEQLQTGSVIEREFSHELIKRVTGLQEEELLAHLSLLKDSELLYERGIYPQLTYIFKHALTQDVVYNSILIKRKKKLHSEIGRSIEELYKDNIAEHYEVLAGHYIIGEDYEKGAEYSNLASKKAEKTGSLNDAIAYAKERVACLERLPRTEDVDKRIIDARTALGLYLNQLANFAASKEAIDPIIDLASRSGYKRRLAQIYEIIGTYNLYVEENFPKASNRLKEALKISKDINHTAHLFFSNFWLGIALIYNCEFEKAFFYLEKALDINVSANSLWGISAVKSWLSTVYHYQGRFNLGYQTSHEAQRIAEESGDTFSKAIAYARHGISCYGKGFLEEAEEYSLMAVDFSERINFLFWNIEAQGNLGETYFEIGKYQKSKDHYGKAIWLLEHCKYLQSWMNLNKMGAARAKVMNNERDIGLKTLCGYAAKNKLRIWDGSMAKYISEILVNIDDQHISVAENWIKKAIEADKRNGMMFHLARDYRLYAELFKKKGDQSKARENLGQAIEIFRKCGADGWVEKYEKELETLL